MTTGKTLSREAIRKAAILVLALDAAAADALLEKMGAAQAQRVRDAVMELDDITPEEEQAVLADFLRQGGRSPVRGMDGVELEPSLVKKMTAAPAAVEPPAAEAETPFHFLRDATTTSLVKHLGNQHPQLIAVVLAHLPASQSAQVVKCLSPYLQASVLRRIAELDMADPAVLESLEQELQAVFNDEIRASKNRLQGVNAVSSILSAAGKDRSCLLNNLESHDVELARLLEPETPATLADKVDSPLERQTVGKVKSAAQAEMRPSEQIRLLQQQAAPPQQQAAPPQQGREPHQHQKQQQHQHSADVARPAKGNGVVDPPLPFEALDAWDDHSLTQLFASCPVDVVLLALAGASPAFVSRLAKQLPAREARHLQRQIAQVGPVRLGDIEDAQRQVAAEAQRLLQADQHRRAGRDKLAAA